MAEKRLISDCSSVKFERVQRKEKNPYVLCTLRGPCMEIGVRNRNNRIYSEQLIRERICENPDVRAKIESRQLLGEGDHPAERTSVSYPEVALAVTDLWIPKDDPTHMWGEFDILPTTKGKDLNAIVEYAGTIGISARALGSHYINSEGAEVLEASDYDFICFDAVPDTGFASARLTVKESKETQDRDREIYSEKSIREVGMVLEGYRSSVGAKSNAVADGGHAKGKASEEGTKEPARIPSSIVESSRKLHENLKKVTSEVEKLKSEKRFLLNQISEMQIGLDKAQKEIGLGKKKAIEERRSTNAELSKQERLVGLYRQQMRSMKDNIEVLRNRLGESADIIADVREAKSRMSDRCREISERLSNAHGENDAILKENDSLGMKMESMSGKMDALQKENRTLHSEIERLESEIERKKTEALRMSERLDASESECRHLEEGVTSLKKSLESTIAEAESSIRSATRRAEKAESMVESLELETRRMKRKESVLSKKMSEQRYESARRMERFRKQEVRERRTEEAETDNAIQNPTEKWMNVFKK